MSSAVNIVAVSARTPLGLNAEHVAAAVRAGVSRVGFHPFMVDPKGEPIRTAHDGELDPAFFGVPRVLALAGGALDELARKLSADAPEPLSVPLVLAQAEPRPGFSSADATLVARSLLQRPYGDLELNLVLPAQGGHAGALHALELAATMIVQGKAELVIAGGVDSYLEADAIDWLDGQRKLARDGVRSGFPPGEGAGFVALANERMRRRLRLPSLARLRGAASAQEPNALDSDVGSLGQGLSEAVASATANLRMPAELITDVYCDINGERFRADEYGFTVLRTQARFANASDYVSAVGEWGDMGAATGALNCVLAVRAWQRNYARGGFAMVWGSSWGGLRAAAVLEQGAS